MKTLWTLILFLLPFIAMAQSIEEQSNDSFRFVEKTSLNAEKFIGVDDFNHIYYINKNTLYKQTPNTRYTYTNTALGRISSVDIKNPLKVLLFYSSFNTAVLLDNRLNELTKPFNFTNSPFSKNVAFMSLSSNDNLWLYSYDDNILSLWNHQTKKIQYNSQPLSTYFSESTDFSPSQLVSSYKNCWLVGEETQVVMQFNEYAIFQDFWKQGQIDFLRPVADGKFVLRNNRIHFYIDKQEGDTELILPLNKEISIKSFYTNKNRIYIFDGHAIFVYEYLKK